MKKTLKLRIELLPDDRANVRIVEQSHRGCEFGWTGSDTVRTSGGISLSSLINPGWAPDLNTFFVRNHTQHDNRVLEVSHETALKMRQAALEYEAMEFEEASPVACPLLRPSDTCQILAAMEKREQGRWPRYTVAVADWRKCTATCYMEYHSDLDITFHRADGSSERRQYGASSVGFAYETTKPHHEIEVTREEAERLLARARAKQQWPRYTLSFVGTVPRYIEYHRNDCFTVHYTNGTVSPKLDLGNSAHPACYSAAIASGDEKAITVFEAQVLDKMWST